jgi:O-antigen ligase
MRLSLARAFRLPNTLLALFFLLLNIQFLAIQTSLFAIKPFHLATIALLPLSLITLRLYPRYWSPFLAFFYFTLFSSLAAPAFGLPLSPLLLNYVFAFLVFLTGATFRRALVESEVISILRFVSWVITLVVIGKTLVYWTDIREYIMDPYAHPELPWLYGGGPNLEATWVIMSVAFFRRSKFFWLFWFLSFAIAVLYASRVAIVLGIALAAFQIISMRRWYILVILPIVGLLGPAIIYVINPYSFVRFLQIGEEPGSATRLEMWLGAWQVLHGMPITGYGAGNAITVIEKATGVQFIEDNVHNYFLQVLLDFGPFGLAIWLWVVAHILRRARVFVSDSEIGTYLVLYFVAGLVQFRGAEPLFWFVAGLFVAAYGTHDRRPKDANSFTHPGL